MKLDKMIGDRFKERPSDCAIESHALMVRGGYMKSVANGIYSQFPPLKRITAKIEKIIRDEMDALDGQEVLFPVALPGSLWKNPVVLKAWEVNFFVLKTVTMLRWFWE